MRHELISLALDEIGVKELPGPVENTPRIIEYFKDIGHKWVKDDETSWCAAVHNFIAKTAGYEHSGALNARSLLDCGIETTHPEKGDTVIYWRGTAADGGGPKGWKGHVGFWIRQEGSLIWTLGGNQKNSYCIMSYPVSKVLGYRILRKIWQ